MSEWWTYTLSDLQSFSLSTYYRLFERYNAAIWPAPAVAFVLGLVTMALLLGGGPRRGRIVAGILAASWLWVAIAFHATRYSTIHWAASYFAWGFGLEAVLIVVTEIVGGGLVLEGPVDAVSRGGLAIFAFALLVAPVIGPLLGRSWRQVEVFGVAPDPTAVATLGALLLAGGRVRWELFVVPAIWCALSGATLLAMEAPGAVIPPLAAGLALLLAAWRVFARRRAVRRT
ncbi:MAG TPA: DUF6064 family protein [Thermoanaerobaculia bacterium]|jgi:hypothetical protein|nr:DUF6064 family protein [Thermoanaerobaculia bacterium]